MTKVNAAPEISFDLCQIMQPTLFFFHFVLSQEQGKVFLHLDAPGLECHLHPVIRLRQLQHEAKQDRERLSRYHDPELELYDRVLMRT